MTASIDGDLLNEATIGTYLAERGLLQTGEDLTATRLSGGVSNVVIRVDTHERSMVVKQALGKLDVADDWFADRGRAQHEAEALRLLAVVTPSHVPHVLDDDADAFALTISAAPPDWVTWKTALMTSIVDPSVARRLGELLRTWHDATGQRSLGAGLDSLDAFRQLRIHPYFEVAASRSADLSADLLDVSHQLTSRHDCLVLGDFSPKNVLVGDDGGLWAIDHEVAHRGDPAFDVAFMASHLVLKALHLVDVRAHLAECVDAFLSGYGPGPGRHDDHHTTRVLGGLLAARVLGSSPVEYLTPKEKGDVLTTAARLLRSSPADVLTKEIPWLSR